jgi:PHD/YefM family antitoxin component YafN of YafNO toxin-antitoxin module
MPKTIGLNEAFKIAQGILSGRAEQQRQQSASATAFFLQGMMNDILNQRQALRVEQRQSNQAVIQGEYNLEQERLSAANDLRTKQTTVDKTFTDPATGKTLAINAFGDVIQTYGTGLKPKDGEEVSAGRKRGMDIELAPLMKRITELEKKRDALQLQVETDFKPGIVEGKGRDQFKKGYVPLEGYEEAKTKIDLQRVLQNIVDVNNQIRQIRANYGFEIEEPPPTVNDPFNWR